MLALKLFGGFELSGPEGVIAFPSAKLQALLAYLALSPRPVPREQVTTLLWGSHFEEQARQNFRQALVRLRKSVGNETIGAGEQTLSIPPGVLSTDVGRFQSLVKQTSRDALREAVSLATGDLLAGLDVQEKEWDDWLSGERRRLATAACDALERLGRMELEAGEPQPALTCAEHCMRRDIFREDAYRLAMRALAALGRRTEAIRLYQHLAERLKEELGSTPERDTAAVYATLRQQTDPVAPPQPLAQARKPSLAVLPFANLSADAEQDYFADGMVDEIITALSRLHWLFVVARNSSFTYKGRAVDAKQVGRELGVRYVLEGSVRRAGNRLRIAGQLVDATTGTAIWADRFDGDTADVFELQDMVTSQVVGAISPRLEQVEIERSRRKPTDSLDAYDYYLRGQAEVLKWTVEGNREALAHFYKAIGLDKEFATPYGMAARCYSQRKAQGWSPDPTRDKEEVARLSRIVAELGPDDPIALTAAGMAVAYVNCDLDAGIAMIERGLELSPNFAQAWFFSGWVRAWRGEADLAVSRIGRALVLSPHDPSVSNMRRGIAFAHFVGGRYEEAVAAAEVVSPLQQNAIFSYATAAAGAAHLGWEEVWHDAMAKLRAADPALRLSELADRFPLKRAADAARWEEGLRKAGLPS